MLLSAISPVDYIIALAGLLGACGGAAALATLVQGGFLRKRQRQREQDALWGFKDPNGILHGGLVDEFRGHIADTSIHCGDGNDGHRERGHRRASPD